MMTLEDIALRTGTLSKNSDNEYRDRLYSQWDQAMKNRIEAYRKEGWDKDLAIVKACNDYKNALQLSKQSSN
jgi:hypothetical protein